MHDTTFASFSYFNQSKQDQMLSIFHHQTMHKEENTHALSFYSTYDLLHRIFLR